MTEFQNKISDQIINYGLAFIALISVLLSVIIYLVLARKVQFIRIYNSFKDAHELKVLRYALSENSYLTAGHGQLTDVIDFLHIHQLADNGAKEEPELDEVKINTINYA